MWRSRPSPSLRTVAVATVALALLASACGADGAQPDAVAEPDPEPDLSAAAPAADGVTDPALAWSGCGDLECADLTVPLDRSDPTGPTIELRISRHRAGDRDTRLGVLLVNPGGPGASGVGLPSSIASAHPELADRFDIVGWDPRGVGASTALECDADLQGFYRLDNDPDDADEQAALDAAAADAAASCGVTAPALLAHIGTSAVVDDMDAIRAALGEDTISYLGLSYGSVLGLGYATRYGERLRAAALDGITDPADTLAEWLQSQAIASDAAFGRLLAAGDGGAAAFETAAALAETGAVVDGGRIMTPSDLARSAILSIYSPTPTGLPGWLLDAAAGDGAGVVSRSDRYLGLAGFDVYTAVKCLDTERPADADAYAEFVAETEALAPLLGAAIANELLPCATWPVESSPIEPISDDDAPPILVLANTGDAATTYADATDVVGRLERAALVTYDGSGHLSFGRGSTCVDDATVDYLVDLRVPEPGLQCE